jgi:hypothetical protein
MGKKDKNKNAMLQQQMAIQSQLFAAAASSGLEVDDFSLSISQHTPGPSPHAPPAASAVHAALMSQDALPSAAAAGFKSGLPQQQSGGLGDAAGSKTKTAMKKKKKKTKKTSSDGTVRQDDQDDDDSEEDGDDDLGEGAGSGAR